MDLPEGSLVFPKQYYEELDIAMRHGGLTGDWSKMNQVKNKMKKNAHKAYKEGKPYSSGGAQYANGGEVTPVFKVPFPEVPQGPMVYPGMVTLNSPQNSGVQQVRTDLERLRNLPALSTPEQQRLNQEMIEKYGVDSKMYTIAGAILSENFHNQAGSRGYDMNFAGTKAGQGVTYSSALINKFPEYGPAFAYIKGDIQDVSNDYLQQLMGKSTGEESAPPVTQAQTTSSLPVGSVRHPGNKGIVSGQQEMLNKLIMTDKSSDKPKLLNIDDVLGPKTRAAMKYYENKGYTTPALLSETAVESYKKNPNYYKKPEQKSGKGMQNEAYRKKHSVKSIPTTTESPFTYNTYGPQVYEMTTLYEQSEQKSSKGMPVTTESLITDNTYSPQKGNMNVSNKKSVPFKMVKNFIRNEKPQPFKMVKNFMKKNKGKSMISKGLDFTKDIIPEPGSRYLGTMPTIFFIGRDKEGFPIITMSREQLYNPPE